VPLCARCSGASRFLPGCSWPLAVCLHARFRPPASQAGGVGEIQPPERGCVGIMSSAAARCSGPLTGRRSGASCLRNVEFRGLCREPVGGHPPDLSRSGPHGLRPPGASMAPSEQGLPPIICPPSRPCAWLPFPPRLNVRHLRKRRSC
jgi:hypothetical protein